MKRPASAGDFGKPARQAPAAVRVSAARPPLDILVELFPRGPPLIPPSTHRPCYHSQCLCQRRAAWRPGGSGGGGSGSGGGCRVGGPAAAQPSGRAAGGRAGARAAPGGRCALAEPPCRCRAGLPGRPAPAQRARHHAFCGPYPTPYPKPYPTPMPSAGDVVWVESCPLQVSWSCIKFRQRVMQSRHADAVLV